MSGLINKSLSTALLAITALGFVAGATACSKEEPVPPVTVPAAADKAADTMKDAADKSAATMKDAAAKAGDTMKDSAAKAGDAMKSAADKATSGTMAPAK